MSRDGPSHSGANCVGQVITHPLCRSFEVDIQSRFPPPIRLEGTWQLPATKPSNLLNRVSIIYTILPENIKL